MLVAVNFPEQTLRVTMPNGSSSGQVLLSTDGQRREIVWIRVACNWDPMRGVLRTPLLASQSEEQRRERRQRDR